MKTQEQVLNRIGGFITGSVDGGGKQGARERGRGVREGGRVGSGARASPTA